jgi:hypothetical protein
MVVFSSSKQEVGDGEADHSPKRIESPVEAEGMAQLVGLRGLGNERIPGSRPDSFAKPVDRSPGKAKGFRFRVLPEREFSPAKYRWDSDPSPLFLQLLLPGETGSNQRPPLIDSAIGRQHW